MSAVVVALMVLVILLVGLGAVLLITKVLRREVDKVHASRAPKSPAKSTAGQD